MQLPGPTDNQEDRPPQGPVMQPAAAGTPVAPQLQLCRPLRCTQLDAVPQYYYARGKAWLGTLLRHIPGGLDAAVGEQGYGGDDTFCMGPCSEAPCGEDTGDITWRRQESLIALYVRNQHLEGIGAPHKAYLTPLTVLRVASCIAFASSTGSTGLQGCTHNLH